MPRRIEFEGKTHEFPDDFNDQDVNKALSSISKENKQELSNNNPEMVSTFLGQMPKLNLEKPIDESQKRKVMEDAIRSASLSSPLTAGGSLLKGFQGLAKNSPFIKSSLQALDIPFTGAAAGAAATPEHPFAGAALGGLAGSIPGSINALKSIGSNIKNAFQKINPSDAVKSIQSFHDNLSNQASNLFNQVSNVAKDRNIGQINIDPSFIDKIKNYLPKTRASEKLIENSKEGNYDSLRKLQTELWHRGSSKKSSILPSDRDIGEEMMDMRDILNEKMIKHFKNVGHPDLSKKLTEAKDLYKHLKDVYYEHGAISKMVGPSRKSPKNIFSVLNEESTEMKKLKNENPFINEILSRKSEKDNAVKSLKRMAKIGGLGLGAAGVMASLPYGYHKFIGE